MNWTEIVIALGTTAISGFFAWLSRRGSIDAKDHAKAAKLSADVAKAASLRPWQDEDDDS